MSSNAAIETTLVNHRVFISRDDMGNSLRKNATLASPDADLRTVLVEIANLLDGLNGV